MAELTPDETLLGLLAANANYGYQLLNCFRDPTQLGRVWNMSNSQVYAVLKRLQQKGLITGREVTAPDAPARTEYCLTEAGVYRLDAWLDAEPSASIHFVRVEFASRLYIARLLNLPTLEIVRRQKETCHSLRDNLSAERANAEPGLDWLMLDAEIELLDAMLRWLDRCELIPNDAE
ncbi:MAG: helix-turn-helix transcriptional regulator [Burkholderiales bacterium]|nr:helix-turn-helix transcriptional regulator [Anaerolineae bacterium]